jgi:DnaK suppressor protein
MDTEKYKALLTAELDALTEELTDIGIQNPENPSDWIERGNDIAGPSADLNEVADRTEEYDERRATVAVLEARYNNIRRALQKIEDGTYGTCEISGEPIEEDRLDANPSARTCKAHRDEEENLSS